MIAMERWTERPYETPGDWQWMSDLTAQRDPDRVADYPGLLDLEEMLAGEAVQQGTMLWQNAAGLTKAFSILDGDMLCFEIAADAPAQELAGVIVARAEERLKGKFEAIFTSCRAKNQPRMELLAANGFIEEPVRTLHFQRNLNEPVPAAELPVGFSIRPVKGEEEVERHVAMHRAAFGTEEMTVAMRLAMMRTSEYDRTLDLVVEAPDGALAGYVMCHIEARENVLRGMRVGYTDPVAVHPDYQRLGLARALLLAGCALLKERGMEFAELGTYGENTGMIRAAQSAGFEVCDTTVFFTRGISMTG